MGRLAIQRNDANHAPGIPAICQQCFCRTVGSVACGTGTAQARFVTVARGRATTASSNVALPAAGLIVG